MIQTLRLTNIVFKITVINFFQESDGKVENCIYRKNQIENLKLNSPIMEIKNLIGKFNSKFVMMEEMISKLEERITRNVQISAQRKNCQNYKKEETKYIKYCEKL